MTKPGGFYRHPSPNLEIAGATIALDSPLEVRFDWRRITARGRITRAEAVKAAWNLPGDGPITALLPFGAAMVKSVETTYPVETGLPGVCGVTVVLVRCAPPERANTGDLT